MLLVDVHAHLDHCKFNDLDLVIERARKADVKAIINNGINTEKNRISLELSKKYDIVKAALGLYPTEVAEMKDDKIENELEFIKKNKNKIIAIGEIGLDYNFYKDKNKIKKQKIVFEKIIDLAEKIKKPLIVHSRKAEKDVINILESSKSKKIVLHCFSGNFNLVKKASELDYYFSIPTNVVFSEHFQKIVEEVNINQLLTETDSPHLSPFKHKRNEPAFIIEGVKKIAKIKGFDLEETSNNIFMNFEKMF